jgi:hypothetical protein
MLEEPGESDLLGKLEQHQLQYKYGGDLGQRSRPATGGRCQSLRAVYHQQDQRRLDGNAQQRNQVPAHRDPPPHTAPCKVGDTSAPRQRGRDQQRSEADAQSANHSVQRQAERQDLGIHNRRDRRRREVRRKADQHERDDQMTRDTAKRQ